KASRTRSQVRIHKGSQDRRGNRRCEVNADNEEERNRGRRPSAGQSRRRPDKESKTISGPMPPSNAGPSTGFVPGSRCVFLLVSANVSAFHFRAVFAKRLRGFFCRKFVA